MEPSELIRRRRQLHGLSQRSLARRAGLTQAALSRIERGESSPNWETIRALMLAMGYQPDLHVERLEGRWDPLHLAAAHERPPAERLALAISASRLAGRLRHAAAGGDDAGG
jgi:transcriptional regulator with XRE-family HTH domain